MRVDQYRELGLAKHVNKARSDDHAARVNSAFSLRCPEEADGGDASIANANIGGVPGRASAVNDVPIADQEIVGRGGLGVEGSDEREQNDGNDGAEKEFGHDGGL